MARARACLLGLVLTALVAAGCTNQKAAEQDPAEQGPVPTVTLPVPGLEGGPPVKGDVTVYAAEELRPMLETLQREFQRSNPDASLAITFGDARVLVVQAVADPPDFYMASAADVARLQTYLSDPVDVGLLGENEYVIAVPEGNPADVEDLAAFAKAEHTAVCSPTYLVPGPSSDAPEGLPLAADTEPGCSTLALTAVANDALDAALVPRSDAAGAEGVEVLTIPPNENFATSYRFVRLGTSDAAVGFENLLDSDRGRTLKRRAGYA